MNFWVPYKAENFFTITFTHEMNDAQTFLYSLKLTMDDKHFGGRGGGGRLRRM
jgi:hypothetical protein